MGPGCGGGGAGGPLSLDGGASPPDRIGGEEFAILTPEVGLKGAHDVAEKVRVVVETTTFRFEKNVIPTTVSLGFAIWLGGDDGADALFKRADTALYAAKQGGKNRSEQG